MVENVEKLGPELDIEAFRKHATEGTRSAARARAALTGIASLEDSIVLKNREVQFRQPWPDQGVAAQVSPSRIRNLESQALSLDVIVGISGIG